MPSSRCRLQETMRWESHGPLTQRYPDREQSLCHPSHVQGFQVERANIDHALTPRPKVFDVVDNRIELMHLHIPDSALTLARILVCDHTYYLHIFDALACEQ